MIPLLTPDNKLCEFYSTSQAEDLKWLRSNGGMTEIILHSHGKKTEKELKAMKAKKKRNAKVNNK